MLEIAGQPVIVDCNHEVEQWLNRFLPDVDFFDDQRLLEDQEHYPEWARSSYPILPRCKINQLVFPVNGYSRFARGLFLVDKHSLVKILKEAWNKTYDPDQLPDYIDESISGRVTSWNADAFNFRSVRFKLFTGFDGLSGTQWRVYCLKPYKVCNDLWILPVVDIRYRRMQINSPVALGSGQVSWSDYFAALQSTLEEVQDALSPIAFSVQFVAPSGYFGCPDIILDNRDCVPVPLLLDAAAHSIAGRSVATWEKAIVCTGATAPSDNITIDQAFANRNPGTELFQIAGGHHGRGFVPRGIDFLGRKHRRWRLLPEPFRYNPTDTTSLSVLGPDRVGRVKCFHNYHTSLPFTEYSSNTASSTAFREYCDNIWEQWKTYWMQPSYDFAVSHQFDAERFNFEASNEGLADWWLYNPCTDFWSITLRPEGPVLRVKSLPPGWYPKYLVAQDGKTPWSHYHSITSEQVRCKTLTAVSAATNGEWASSVAGAGRVALYPSGVSSDILPVDVVQLMADVVDSGSVAVAKWVEPHDWVIDNYSC